MLLDLDARTLLFYRNGKQLGPGYDGVGDRAPIEGPVVFFVESCRPSIGAQLTIVQEPKDPRELSWELPNSYLAA